MKSLLDRCISNLHKSKYEVVEDNDEVDRISELSKPILHQILSFLPTKDAIITSVLSKTWYSAWNSFPVLDFDQNDYFHGNDYSFDPVWCQAFYNYVDNSIARRCQNVSIQRFSLVIRNRKSYQSFQNYLNSSIARRCQNLNLRFNVPMDNFYPYLINIGYVDEYLQRWINNVVSKNVEDLALIIYPMNWSRTNALHMPTLFCASKSLKALHLSGFNIVMEEESAYIIDRHNIFSSLEKLKLHNVHIDEQILRSLLLISCSLEEVSIDNCDGIRSVSLCSAKLKSVELQFFRGEVEKITIEAPNLRHLSLGGGCVDVLRSILEASSKSYAKNLKELVLRQVCIDDAIFRLIRGFGGVLENLKMIECQVVESVQISSCRLISYSVVKYNEVELVADCLSCWKQEVSGAIGKVKNGLNRLTIK